jgi:hypothetical protein
MPAGWRRARVVALGVTLLALSLTRLAFPGSPGWLDDFAQGRLDPARWQRTVEGDVREWSAEVVETPGRGSGFRLRLTADTRGTRDDTLKFVGVRSVGPVALRDGARVAVRLDWGEQANGSYLTAGIVLSPHATGGNPLATPDWLQVVYVGVPPGRNARLVVAYRAHGRERTVHTEGWPDTNRQGRRIGVQDVVVRMRDGAFEVWEGERLVWRSEAGEIAPVPAHLYLQMSSHSNYPARSIYFERVEVR